MKCKKIYSKKWIYIVSWFKLITWELVKIRKQYSGQSEDFMRFAVLAIILGLFPIITEAASHRPQEFFEEVNGKPDEGRQIVEHFCAVCHAENPQIPLGAPRQNVDADWQERVKQGLGGLLEHTADGLNAMPARGGCFECSDEQLTKAILALMPEKYRKKLQVSPEEEK